MTDPVDAPENGSQNPRNRTRRRSLRNRSELAGVDNHNRRSGGRERFPEPLGTDPRCRWEPVTAYRAEPIPAPLGNVL